jgi:AraC-like DNA-binding protein
MFSTIIFFITAAIGLLCTALIFGKNNNQEYSLINKYLLIIIVINVIRFLFHGISQAYPEIEIEKLVNILDISIGMLIPCYYLYLQNIVFEKKSEVSNLFHFITPFFIGGLFITIAYASADKVVLYRKLFFIIGLLFYLIYSAIAFLMLYKYVWNRKSDINAIQKQNNLIKNWSIFVYVSFLLMFLIRAISGITSSNPGNFSNSHLWMLALVWIGICVKIILTPEILYGYNFLNKTIDAATERVVLSSVWNLKGTVLPITNEKDKKLEEKMKPLLMEYVHKIEAFSFHTQSFRNPNLTPEDVAVALKIPISHIQFILKFHCNESFTDYKKTVRIHDATKLLKHGYLNDHKVESLATTVGFSSYNTFSIAFKNITGVTTQKYLKRF